MSKGRRLKSIEDVRRYLAHLVNAVESGEIEPMKGGRLAYISNILLNAIRNSDLEERIAHLEERANQK